MSRQLLTTRFADAWSVVGQRRIYRAMLYLLAAVPLGLIYVLLLLFSVLLELLRLWLMALWTCALLLLVGGGALLLWLIGQSAWLVYRTGATLGRWTARGLIIVTRAVWRTCRTIGRVLLLRPRPASAMPAPTPRIVAAQSPRPPRAPSWRWPELRRVTAGRRWLRFRFSGGRSIAACCWLLAGFERNHAVRWLEIDLPVIARPRADAAAPFPWTILALLIATLICGVIGSGMIVVGGGATVALLITALAMLFDSQLHLVDLPLMLLLVLGAAGGVALATLHGTAGLVRLWSRFAYAMLSANDTVRRLREAEAQAAQSRANEERAERSRRDLIINVSHELRTPTASIRGHVESLLLALDHGDDPATTTETLKTYLGIVQREADRLSTLVDELLSLARAETDELHLVIAPVDAAGVIDEVYQALAPLARRERQVAIVRQIAPELPPLLADRQRLAQVLLNLVRNAITYTPAGSIVSISLARATADHLTLAVANTGSGIAADELDRIWERFYRTDASRARATGGFGLGLAIVRDLVEAMGGQISVASTPGEGSRFEVRLPIAVPVPQTHTHREATIQRGYDSGGRRRARSE